MNFIPDIIFDTFLQRQIKIHFSIIYKSRIGFHRIYPNDLIDCLLIYSNCSVKNQTFFFCLIYLPMTTFCLWNYYQSLFFKCYFWSEDIQISNLIQMTVIIQNLYQMSFALILSQKEYQQLAFCISFKKENIQF